MTKWTINELAYAKGTSEPVRQALLAMHEKLNALEQPAEPVAWAVYDVKHGGSKTLHWHEQHTPHGDPEHFNAVPLYAQPPSKPDPAADAMRDFFRTGVGVIALQDKGTS